MSFGLWPYAVDLALLATAPKPLRKLSAALAQLDDDLNSDHIPRAQDVVDAIASGHVDQDDPMLGFVVEVFCGVVGDRLPNPVWERYNTDFFSDLDDELTARGLRGKNAMVEIVQSCVPALGVRICDPECGTMPPEQVSEVGALIDGMDLSALTDGQRKGAAEWRAWMRAAEQRRNRAGHLQPLIGGNKRPPGGLSRLRT